MRQVSIVASRRDFWIAVAYVPALVVMAGPPYLALRAGLQWLLPRVGLPLANRMLAVDGLSGLASVPLVLAGTWLYLRLVKAGGLADLGLRRAGLAPLALPAGLLIAGSGLGLALAADVLRGALAVHGLNPLLPWLVVAAVGIAMQAGWTEEVVCRGVLLQFLERGLSRPLALILSTAYFVLAHLPSEIAQGPIRWVMLVLSGLTFAAAYYAAGRNLWLAIGLHWGVDLWAYLAFGLPGARGSLLRWQLLEGNAYGMAGYVNQWLLIALPLFWLALAAWYLVRRRASGRQHGSHPAGAQATGMAPNR